MFIKIIAHRGGYESNYKPNTKECLLDALDNKNIIGVEIDVRLTKDKKIVIIHDSLINFVSNGSGIVKKMTLKKLKKYNFGSEKYPSKIVTLDEFLKCVDSDKIILIEIKDKDAMINDILYNTLKKYELNFFVCSFHYDIILDFKKKYKYKNGLIVGYGQNLKRLYNHFDFNITTYYYKDRVSKKKPTFIWTINNIRNNLDDYFIITDYPSLFY